MEEILHSGFLTKSPPEHKINRARWQRRWFILKRSANAIYLQYYKDQHTTRPKGTIDLTTCEQVDQGLTFESKRNLAKAFIFDIVTPKRKYFLVSNTELDMIRWVREICLACGFQLDNQDDDSTVQPAEPSQPINVTPSRLNEYTPRPYPASVPTEATESYIPLGECQSGKNRDLSQSVPVNGGWDSIGHRQVNSQDLDPRRSRTSSSGSNSSIPSENAPLPPPSETNPAMMENYDIPPALQRLSGGSMQPMYDIPPALLRREPSFQNQDDIYKSVPVPRRADLNTVPDEQNQLNGNAHDLYSVPPSHRGEAGGLYDVPPVHSLIKNQNKEMSSSTDKLAQDFQQISVRNSRGAYDDAALDLYSVPPSRNTSDPFASPDSGSQTSATPPPRPPKLNHASATNIETQAMPTPPRPPKPQHLRPSTPPPSFDDTYAVPPSHSRPVPSQELIGRLIEAPIYSVPPSANLEVRPAPSGHQWLDSKVPTPGGSDYRYINTSKSANRQSIPPKSASFIHQPVAPPPRQLPRSATIDLDSRYIPSPVAQQESYLSMDGSSDSSSVFQYPASSAYMAMEGTNSNGGPRLDGRSLSESQPETYATMNPGVPLQRRSMPIVAHRHTFSGGERPPPIDRSLKPDRKISEGAVRSTDHIGMVGSFYATKESLRPLPDLRPIQSDRTRSFSKRPGSYENQRLDTDCDLFRGRSNTGDSTTSSSDDDMYSPGESDFYFPRPVPPVPEEDTYIYKDVPGVGGLPEHPITEGLSTTPIPASLPSQQNDEIEYLELSHEEEARQPPPRPPRPSSPTVEYIDLDPDKTQALRFVTEKREEEKDGSMSGRSTLTRRDV